ncbi:MAG TPA: cobalamin-binding protein [Candidatus Angelobacter sp.]|nr:cobalamin-binding protein [Candidatus Angelobacter sp.]
MNSSRIVSFLPSATEMVCLLGLADQLVGVTHECDYPESVAGTPVVVRSAIPVEQLSQAEIELAVAERVKKGQSIYEVDEALLRELAPDVILTQDLCAVCAPSGNEITQALHALPSKPEIVWLTPRNLSDIADNIRQVGGVTGCSEKAEEWIATQFGAMDEVARMADACGTRPKVFCMEWLDPVYSSGHWVPEMVRIAGGIDKLGREGEYSVPISWNEVLDWAPEILVVMPCGNHLDKVMELAPQLRLREGWHDLPAVRKNQVYAVDASSYFARPGPRVLQGVELLAHLIHPEKFAWQGPASAYRRFM